jgi:hypothetical protein
MVNEEMDAADAGHRQRLDIVMAEIADSNHCLERLYDALETGALRLEDLAPRIQLLRRRQEQLQATRLELEQHLSDKRVELADLATVTHYVEDLRNILSKGSLAERKVCIRSFVKEVMVTEKEAVLTYTMPLAPKGTMEGQIAVPSIVRHGGQYSTIGRTFEASAKLVPVRACSKLAVWV